jgi:hypothetical protein
MSNEKNEFNKAVGRMRRGQASREFDSKYVVFSDEELIAKLDSFLAQERTSVARILGHRRCVPAIGPLCDRLKKETALYARISISEALGEIGETAIPHLAGLLGRVGKNQYKVLPTKGFYKRNYPLPRDIAARTIVKIGVPALSSLEGVVAGGERECVLEAIDAIGSISFYEKVARSTSVLMDVYQASGDDLLLLWKVLRAFQAFSSDEVRAVLEMVIGESAHPVLRWEAVRSLGQQKQIINPKIVAKAHADCHAEVRHMAKLFLKYSD